MVASGLVPEQEVMIDGAVEKLLESGGITGLTECPHGLGYGGFQCHIVGFDQIELILHYFSDLIDLHITSFVGDLGSHDDDLAVAELGDVEVFADAGAEGGDEGAKASMMTAS